MKRTAAHYAQALLAVTEGQDKVAVESIVRRLARTLRVHHTEALFPGIVHAAARLLEQRRAREAVHVTTARAMPHLAALLKKKLGSAVTIAEHVDPQLIGGAVVRHGDTLVDGSVRTALARLRAFLTHPSSS